MVFRVGGLEGGEKVGEEGVGLELGGGQGVGEFFHCAWRSLESVEMSWRWVGNLVVRMDR